MAFIALAQDLHNAVAGVVLLQNFGCVIGRAIVNNDDLRRRLGLSESALDSFHNEAAVIVAIDEYGHCRHWMFQISALSRGQDYSSLG